MNTSRGDEKARRSLADFIGSSDPLSDEACEYLLEYQEEDERVDYKESFDPKSAKCWVDLEIDVAAFANTFGGYLVYGIKDKTYKRIGLSAKAHDQLCDIKQVLEKVNRHVQPKFTSVRSKGLESGGLKFVALHVPQSRNKTHIFVSNVDIKLPSRTFKTMIWPGMVYVRRSGSNQIMTSQDFEELMYRRIHQQREKLLGDITRVITAEPDQQVLVVSPEEKTDGAQKFTISDSPDALPLKGVSFSVTPKNKREQIAAWTALHKGDAGAIPPEKSLMAIYADRHQVNVPARQKAELAYFALVRGLPAFFWLKGLGKKESVEILERAFAASSTIEKLFILNVSGFYGKDVYAKFYKTLGEQQRAQIKPVKDLVDLFKTGKLKDVERAEEEATELALELAQQHDMASVYRVRTLDCGLYAPF